MKILFYCNHLLLLFSAILSVEKEAQSFTEPKSSELSEREVALQEALSSLQQEKDAVTAQFQSQVTVKLFDLNILKYKRNKYHIFH